GTGGRRAQELLRRPQPAGPEEEAVDVRAAGLAQAAAGRGHPRRRAAIEGREGLDPAADRRAAEERAGREAVREADLHAAKQPLAATGPAEPVPALPRSGLRPADPLRFEPHAPC